MFSSVTLAGLPFDIPATNVLISVAIVLVIHYILIPGGM